MKKYTSIYTGKEIDERLSKVDDIPKSISELENDVEFVTQQYTDTVYEKKETVNDIKVTVDEVVSDVENLTTKIDNINVENFKWTEVL